MTGLVSIPRRMATLLIRLAGWMVPETRAVWRHAMWAEFQDLHRDHDALVWATGCLFASITMRIETMIIGNLKVSRWVLAPELLFCFAPLTLAWLDSIFGMSGVIRLNLDIIQKYFINDTTGIMVLVMMIALALLGVLGPAGLFIGLRQIAFGRLFQGKLPYMVLITGPLLLGAIYITGWIITGTELRADYWGAVLLFSLLPALGAAHMYHLRAATPGTISVV